jgi:hypothetical protein
MEVDLFAGLPISDYQRALTWYERLLGSEPAFFPNETEAVWELAEHRYLYIEELPGRAGGASWQPPARTAKACSTIGMRFVLSKPTPGYRRR